MINLKSFLINWVIYFMLITIVMAFLNFITGGFIHGVVIVRMFICMFLAYTNPIYK